MEPSVPFHQLPTVVIVKVMSYVPLRDTMTATKVCLDWASLIHSIRSIWKYVSIDHSSPFGGDWRQENTNRLLCENPTDEKVEYERIMDEFLLELSNTTDLIEHFKIDVWSYEVQGDTLLRLLEKQKRLLSLSLAFSWSNDWAYFESSSRQLLQVIKTHQRTLECLEVSKVGITFEHWQKYLSQVDFPRLKKISYPLLHTSDDEETVIQCFAQTLKHGKLEEINMNSFDDYYFMCL